jgi:nitroimidazol reductase NimA-like FMN-containing flavoprotein (pyridoxamine 5'-phosphate oxidase superfamily)
LAQGWPWCEGSNICFPSGATILTFGGIASFLPFQFSFAQREWIDIFSLPARETERLKGVLRMNEPITKLDTRHGVPRGGVTPWEETRRVLETAELFWLSTVRADGRPHVTPLVAVWHDGAIHFTTADTAQKTVNLRGNPHVILTTGCNQKEGFNVVVEGDAVRITDQDALERLASVWATKWDGSWPYQVRNGYFYLYDEDEQRVLTDSNLVFSVKPRKVFAFAIGLSQTRYQF